MNVEDHHGRAPAHDHGSLDFRRPPSSAAMADVSAIAARSGEVTVLRGTVTSGTPQDPCRKLTAPGVRFGLTIPQPKR